MVTFKGFIYENIAKDYYIPVYEIITGFLLTHSASSREMSLMKTFCYFVDDFSL